MPLPLPDPYVGGDMAGRVESFEDVEERLNGIQRNFEKLAEQYPVGQSPTGLGFSSGQVRVGGPWDTATPPTGGGTIGVSTGQYLVTWGLSAFATAGASLGTAELWIDGVNEDGIAFYFNTASEHHWMGSSTFVHTLTQGTHTFIPRDSSGFMSSDIFDQFYLNIIRVN